MHENLSLYSMAKLVGARALMSQVEHGHASFSEAADTLHDLRAVYPGTRLDYHVVLDTLDDWLERLRKLAAQQQVHVHDLLASTSHVFDYDPDRLLRKQEFEALQAIANEGLAEHGRLAQEASDVGSELEGLEEPVDLTDDIDAALVAVETAKARLEAAKTHLAEAIEDYRFATENDPE